MQLAPVPPAPAAAITTPTATFAATAPAGPAAVQRTVDLEATRAGESARLVPGDSPRSLSAAFEQVGDAVRDLFGRRPNAPLPTAGAIDLERYAGRWYELARLPVRFQDPRTVSTADYALRADGSVEVRNTAYLGEKVDARITGSATPARGAEETADRLRVKFGGLLRFIPTPKDGNYWIIDRADDYSTALVGTPDRKFLWVLARDKDAWGTAPIDAMVTKARELGFDTDSLLVADWQRQVIRQGA
jgi:apolipoprotein D and lipocalin family protein